MDSIKRSIILITALLLAVAQGAWAQAVIPVRVTDADGQAFDLTFPSAKCNWTPAKAYVAGKVYKVANKSLSTTPAGGNLPR